VYPFFYRQLDGLNNPKRKRMARALTWFTRTIIFIIYALSLLIVIGQRGNDTTQPTRQVQQLSIPDAETSCSTASCAG